jgi:hypothetical protein
LAGAPASEAAQQLVHISSDLKLFIGDMPPFDDITLVILCKE